MSSWKKKHRLLCVQLTGWPSPSGVVPTKSQPPPPPGQTSLDGLSECKINFPLLATPSSLSTFHAMWVQAHLLPKVPPLSSGGEGIFGGRGGGAFGMLKGIGAKRLQNESVGRWVGGRYFRAEQPGPPVCETIQQHAWLIPLTVYL